MNMYWVVVGNSLLKTFKSGLYMKSSPETGSMSRIMHTSHVSILPDITAPDVVGSIPM